MNRHLGLLAAAAALVFAAGAPAMAQRTLVLSPGRPAVYCLAYSPDGTKLVSGDAQGGVVLWDVAGSARPVLLGRHLRVVYGVAFAPDGRTIASGCHDHTVKLWDAVDKKETATLRDFRGRVYSVAFAPKDNTLATGGGVFVTAGEARLWDAGDKNQARGFDGLGQWVRSVAFSPDGAMLATGGGRLLRFGELRLWDAAGGKDPVTIGGLPDEVLATAFSPDGKTLAAAGRDMNVRLFGTADGKPERVLRGHTAEVFFVGYADGRTIVSAGFDNTVRSWDAEAGRQLGMLYDPLDRRRDGEVFCAALSKDGKQLALGTLYGRIKVWDTVEALRHARRPLYPVVWTKPRGYPVPVRPALPE